MYFDARLFENRSSAAAADRPKSSPALGHAVNDVFQNTSNIQHAGLKGSVEA